MRRTRCSPGLALLAACLGLTTLSQNASAQFMTPPPPAAFALSDVTLVAPDGSRREGVTIVVRGGLIENIGPGLAVPDDAEVLEGDSLSVYPGLVDAQGSAPFEFPEAQADRSRVRSWTPPREAQSFTPHRRVVDYLTAKGDDLADARKAGVVAAAVLPEGRVMPGRGTVLLYRKGVESPYQLVAVPELGPAFSFRGAQGVYPNQLFAVIAFIRQSYEDAVREGLIMREYQRDPHGLATPIWDPDYEVLRSTVEGGTPVYFYAEQAEDIGNVLMLAREYGFRPVIVGGAEAWRLADRLAREEVPVLVSLDFPEPERWEPEPTPEPSDTAAAQPQQQEELEPGAAKEKERLENLYSNAGRLAAAGVTFALTSGGGAADLLEGTRKAIEYGLEEQDALAALTLTPATLLGIPNVVAVEPGMAATFIVTDGPLFAEDTRIVYTFVEGEMEEGAARRSAAGGEAPTVNVTGVWDVDLGEFSASMNLTQAEGGSVSGTFDFDFGSGDVTGSVSGNGMSLVITLEFGGQSMEVDLNGTVRGNTASGQASSPQGDTSWTAKRKGGPGREARQ